MRTGQRVRVRIGNLSPMDHHPIHLHGYQFKITETDAGEIPQSAQWPETTVLVPVGSTRTIEFVANAPGDWAMHCHMTHHVMNQMGHGVPNLIGVEISNFKCGHDAPIYGVVEGIIEQSGTPYFCFKDLDENKPTGSIRIRVETINYFLKRYAEQMQPSARTADIEQQIAEYEKNLREQLLREAQFAELAMRQHQQVDTSRFLPLATQAASSCSGEHVGVRPHLSQVVAERLRGGDPEARRLRGDHVVQRAALHAR